MSRGTVELIMLIAVVVLAIAAGLLLGVLLRRRARGARREARPGPRPLRATTASGRVMASRPLTATSSPPPVPTASLRRARSNPSASGASPASATGGAAASVGGAVTIGTSDRVCPACRTTYQDMNYCQKDARRLVPMEELGAPGRTGGLACPRCGRGFEHGLRRCPHDGGELVPLAMYQATRRRRDSGPTGVLAKVCPVCRRKYDLSSRFCGRDGHELLVVN